MNIQQEARCGSCRARLQQLFGGAKSNRAKTGRLQQTSDRLVQSGMVVDDDNPLFKFSH
jgi:hypothetical protein